MKNSCNNNKKVTMRDVAEAVGVSLATVSYVLNHSEKEKISHETRLAVLETAKRMNYVPNLSARSLSAKKSNMVGIIVNIGEDDSYGKKSEYYDLAAELQKQFKKLSYDTIISYTNRLEDIDIISKRSLEATFVIDVEEKDIKKITSNYYVPVIFINCDFEENLFYKILPDYESMFNKAKKLFDTSNLFVICENIVNERVKKIFEGHFKEENIFMNDMSNDLSAFIERHKSMKGIVIGDVLGLQVEQYIPDEQFIVISHTHNENIMCGQATRFEVSNEMIAKNAIEVLKRIFALDYDEDTKNRILLPFRIRVPKL